MNENIFDIMMLIPFFILGFIICFIASIIIDRTLKLTTSSRFRTIKRTVAICICILAFIIAMSSNFTAGSGRTACFVIAYVFITGASILLFFNKKISANEKAYLEKKLAEQTTQQTVTTVETNPEQSTTIVATQKPQQIKIAKSSSGGFFEYILYFFSLAGTGIFTYFLPQLWWNISWQDLSLLVSNSKEAKIMEALSETLKRLGVISKNMKTWASERIVICLAIGLGIFLFLAIIIHLIFKNKKNT